jgi:hypothetical protein
MTGAVTTGVGLGLVPSFNRPGGNLTGVATLSSGVMARLELLHEIAPRADAFAVLINPKNPSAAISAKEAQNAARALGKSIHIVHASAQSELEPAFATIAQLRAGALLSLPTDCSSLMPLRSPRFRSGMRFRQATNARISRCGRLDELWRKPSGRDTARGGLYGPHSQRRKAG